MASSDRDPKVVGSVSIQVPGHLRYLHMVRKKVMEQSQKAGLSNEKTAQLEMAVDEACTNIIEHSYGVKHRATEGHEDGLRINFLHYIDRVVIEIFDHGTGFEFRKHKVIEPGQFVEHRRARGLGMFIITRFVDDVSYERGTPSGNYLRLTKRLK